MFILWWDFYKLFTYSFEPDPLTKRDVRQHMGAGITQPDIPDIRAGGEWGGGSSGMMAAGRDTNEMIDLTTVTNRGSRYKEYERLLNVAEIDNAMTVFADEACLAGHIPINTPFFGLKPIRWFQQNKANEEFLVYCWDFTKHDYTLGWAYNPRLVGVKKTVRVKFDDGSATVVTEDHRMLLRDEEWRMAGDLKIGDELMPFYRLEPDVFHNKEMRVRQFPRIFTHKDGWKHERWFMDEWRMGVAEEKYEKVAQALRVLGEGVPVQKAAKIVGNCWEAVEKMIHEEGFTLQEIRRLAKKPDSRRVIHVEPWEEQEVFDLSVRDHENFCGESIVYHNCQKGENKHVFDLEVKDDSVRAELEFLFFHRRMLNVDRNAWEWAKKLFMYGDMFLEMLISPDDPSKGILGVAPLPPDSIYRIETTKGRLIEFQQSKEGPDYQALTRAPVTQATDADNQQSFAIRFAPKQLVHLRIGDGRKTFYPYGVSLIEAARGPAHQLRLMEDAMVVYRLTRAPERRVFYIDTGQLPPMKAESFMRRVQDLLRKKKVPGRGGVGASAVEERWQAPSADEDFWIPTRPNSNTRVETLPGAQNLGEIDDALYFRQKLYTALNFPRNYMNSEDPQATRISLSAQDVKFARFIERLQDHMVDGFLEVAERHLELRGFPEESYEDLTIKMTPPSEWRELSRAEIVTNRINNANSLKGSMLMSTYDILTEWMKYSHEQALRMIARTKMEKIEELKLQIIGQNPQLMGIGGPSDGSEPEMGAEPSGPNPMLSPEMGGGMPPAGGAPMPPAMANEPPGGDLSGMGADLGNKGAQTGGNSQPLPEAEPDEIKKYDLEILDYDKELDREELDYSTGR